jgi:long-subunit acyl-CoA synthetase (AMP-forming)
MAGVSLQIRDTSTGVPLGPNEQGEIFVKSNTIFHSYFKNDGATQDALVDGWFKTGDIGMYDTDGFVYFADRMKEMFKHNGNHVRNCYTQLLPRILLRFSADITHGS